MRKNSVKPEYLIEKKNDLNNMVKSDLTVEELKILSIYLSKINARDVGTRAVRFTLGEMQSIMGIGRMNTTALDVVTNRLLQHVVRIPTPEGRGVEKFQLFKRCRLEKDENGTWTIEIDAHDESLPLMFDFKQEYFTYKLQNVLSLASSNQIRMYEILKQYEKIGQRELTIEQLKDLLAIKDDDYSRWDNFKSRVLDSCQEALEKYTDIKFTYEKGKSGPGGKWLSVIFTITANSSERGKVELIKDCSEYVDAVCVSDSPVNKNTILFNDEEIEIEGLF